MKADAVEWAVRGLVALVVVVAALSVVGCGPTMLDDSIGVAPGENAIMCAHVDLDPAWSESRASYRRAEIPEGAKLEDLTPEQIAALYDC